MSGKTVSVFITLEQYEEIKKRESNVSKYLRKLVEQDLWKKEGIDALQLPGGDGPT